MHVDWYKMWIYINCFVYYLLVDKNPHKAEDVKSLQQELIPNIAEIQNR